MIELAEVPFIFLSSYILASFLPSWLAVPYEYILYVAGPIITIVEGICTVFVIISFGKMLVSKLEERQNFIKLLILLICIGLFLVFFWLDIKLLFDPFINVVSASLISSILTILIIQTLGTIIAEHGIITDVAMLFAYVSINLWLISFDWSRRVTPSSLNHSFVPLFSSFSAFNIYSSIKSSLRIFSQEMVLSLMFRMAIFLSTAGFLDDEDREIMTWIRFLQCFGKSFFVLIYTCSWLNEFDNAFFFFMDPIVWKWINIYLVLILYSIHLLSRGSDE